MFCSFNEDCIKQEIEMTIEKINFYFYVQFFFFFLIRNKSYKLIVKNLITF